MPGDYTRFTFDPMRRYSGVWMQQGRVQLDADWNEGVDILKDRVRKLSLDVLGRVGVPHLVTPNAFAIGVVVGPALDLTIGAGRIYVDGFMAENFIPPATYLTQPFLPDPPALPLGDVLVVLDLWEREVTYIEDPKLLDVALGGVDTTTRIQQVWQLLVVPPPPGQGAQCGIDLNALFPPSAGRLTTEAIAPPAPDDPCILPPVAGYRGLENRLYRLEVHNGGPIGVARFKWSRDDASIVSSVSAMAVAGGQTRLNVNRLGRDQVLRFRIDDWVTVTDDHRELHGETGDMAKIIDVDEVTPAIVLDRALPTGPRPFGALPADLIARHTRVELWNQKAAINVLDADGLMLTAPGPIDIEDGIRVRFTMDPVGGSFHVGDYWVFAARTADASVEILTAAPPRGIIHHYAQLAAITGLGGVNIVSDCRPPPPEDCACCCVVTVAPPGDPGGDFHSLADAVAALPGLPINPAAPVMICLLRGEHPVPVPITLSRPFVTIQGCGLETIVRPRSAFISMEAEGQVLEDFAILAESARPLITMISRNQRLSRLWVRNTGPGAMVNSFRAEELVIEDCQFEGTGGLDLAAIELDVLRNHLRRGPLAISGPSLDVRIRDNRLEDSATHGLALRGNFIQQVDVHRNLIRGAQGNGISFDGGDVGPIVANLTISHNDIMGCVGRSAVPTALPFGGIVLGRMIELEIRDNRITDNGGDGRAAVCGVYVHRSFGAEVSRNLISNNGRPADGGAPLPGRQAGVYLAGAQIGIGSTPDPGVPGGLVLTVGNVPAARIVGNDIDSPRGHALAIIGAGPMAVEGNRLQCHDILREPGAAGGGTPLQNMLNWVGTVAIVNFGLPSWFYAFLLGAGFSGAPGWGAISITGFSLPNSQIGGHIQFRGNQVRLDLSQTHAELALANMLIISLDDVQVADNQSEGVLRANPAGLGGLGPGPGGGFDFLMADLAAFAITLRQADNGFMTTPYLTAFSIMSGAVVNHCLGNQTTSCINAVGGAPKSKRMNNAILFPHPLFCKDAGLGFD